MVPDKKFQEAVAAAAAHGRGSKIDQTASVIAGLRATVSFWAGQQQSGKWAQEQQEKERETMVTSMLCAFQPWHEPHTQKPWGWFAHFGSTKLCPLKLCVEQHHHQQPLHTHVYQGALSVTAPAWHSRHPTDALSPLTTQRQHSNNNNKQHKEHEHFLHPTSYTCP